MGNADKDLMYICSKVEVLCIDTYDVVYDLIGYISDSGDEDDDELLEQYLISDSQVMARMKQTGRKQNTPPNLFPPRGPTPLSPGGLPIALQSPRRGRSTNMGSKNPVGATRSSPRKRHNLPDLFTSDDDPSDGSSHSKHSKRSKTDSENELGSPGQGNTSGKPARQQIPSKALKKMTKPPGKMTMKELCARWNRTG